MILVEDVNKNNEIFWCIVKKGNYLLLFIFFMSKIDIMKYYLNIEDILLFFKRGYKWNVFNVLYFINNLFIFYYFVMFMIIII